MVVSGFLHIYSVRCHLGSASSNSYCSFAYSALASFRMGMSGSRCDALACRGQAYGALVEAKAITNLRDFAPSDHAPICWAKSTMLEETTSKSPGLALSGTPTGPLPY